MNDARGPAMWALLVIFVANFLSYLDRQLVSALEEPIVHAMGLTEPEFGLLWTLFTVGYMTFALPIGWLADRGRRSQILAACIVVWSIATCFSGFAESKWLLYASRFFIGVGEAGCLVIGQALVADFFGSETRGRALSVFHLAVPLGGTAAFILAGALEDVVNWRMLFYLAGLPGLLVAALVLSLSEPPKLGGGDGHGHGGGAWSQYLELFKTPTLLLVILAQAFAVMLLVPVLHFGAKYLADQLQIDSGVAKVTMGVLALVAGGSATLTSGFIGDRLSRTIPGGYALVAAVGFGVGLPCFLIGFRTTELWVAFPALSIGCFALFLCQPAVNAQIASVAAPAQRATAWSLAVFVLHLLGDTTAPVAFGWVSKEYSRMQAFTGFSFALLVAAVLCAIAVRTAPADVARASRSALPDGAPHRA